MGFFFINLFFSFVFSDTLFWWFPLFHGSLPLIVWHVWYSLKWIGASSFILLIHRAMAERCRRNKNDRSILVGMLFLPLFGQKRSHSYFDLHLLKILDYNCVQNNKQRKIKVTKWEKLFTKLYRLIILITHLLEFYE